MTESRAGETRPRIMHFADFHIDSDEKTLRPTRRAGDELLAGAQANQPDLIVIAGDYFNRKLHFDSEAARFAIDFLQRLSNIAPVLLLEGTETHDRQSLETLASVQVINDVKIVMEPSIVNFDTSPALRRIDFFCMPGIKKRYFEGIAAEFGFDMAKTQVKDLVAYQFHKWSEMQLARQGREPVFVGHVQLGLEGLEKMETGYEPGISPVTVDLIKPTLGLLGHVHDVISHNGKCGRYHYSGSIVAKTMGEAEVVEVSAGGAVKVVKERPKKGFYIHTSLGGGKWESSFTEISTTRFCKIIMNADNEKDLEGKMNAAKEALKDRAQGCMEDGLVCKFNIETPDTAVPEAVLKHENTIRNSLGSVVDIVSPAINVTSFSSYVARVEDSSAWQGKDPRDKFHDWMRRRGYESDEAEVRELDEKIRMVL